MVYEHLLGCFMLEDPSLKFLVLFQVVADIVHGDIFRSMALVLGVSRLLTMEENINGLRLTTISAVFLQLINHSIIL
jgi:hypothetical protein